MTQDVTYFPFRYSIENSAVKEKKASPKQNHSLSAVRVCGLRLTLPMHLDDNHKSSWGIWVEDKVVDIISILLSWCSVDIHGTGHCWTTVEPPNTPNQWSTRPSMHPARSAAQPILPPPLCPDLWGQCVLPHSPLPCLPSALLFPVRVSFQNKW